MPPGTSDPGLASSALVSRVAAVRALEVPLARYLCASLRSGEPFGMLHGSLVDFGRSHGLGSSEVHRLVSVGFLLEKHPEVEALLLSARLSLENAAQLHDLYAVEGAVRDGEDWVAAACDLATSDLRKRVERRLAEVASGPRVQHVGVFVPTKVAEGFDRCRDLASRKARRRVSRAETFATLVDTYLEKHDPLHPKRLQRAASREEMRKPVSLRRPASLAADFVPLAEKTKNRLRFGDRCAVDGCSNTAYLEHAHIIPRALGGANAAWNLLLLCSRHHRMFDAGRICLRGDVPEERHFVNRHGRFVAKLRPPPESTPA